MAQTSGLTVRQFERQEVTLRVTLTVADDHHRIVTFSATSGLNDGHTIEGRSVDFSSGGAGLLFTKFVPRAMRGVLRVYASRDASGADELILEHDVKVQRVMLRDHTPEYFVGVSFQGEGEAFEQAIGDFLATVATLVPSQTGGPADG